MSRELQTASALPPSTRAAVIELDGSHTETLYSHVRMLTSLGFEVDLVLGPGARRLLGDPGPVAAIECFDVSPELWRSVGEVRRLNRYLRERGIGIVVFNTAEGRRVRNFCLFSRGAGRWVGALHNAHKLGTSFTQTWITRRLGGYFVLAESIARNVDGHGLPIEPFFPIYFPAVDAGPPHDDVFEVVVPGRIDSSRRDYAALLDELVRAPLAPAIRIVLLGDGASAGGREVGAAVGAAGLGRQVEVSSGFVPEAELLRRVAAAQLVLPLITPRCPGFAAYRRTKVTGAYDLAYGLGVPLLSHASLADVDEMKVASLFFEDGRLVSRLNALVADPSVLNIARERIRAHPGFAWETQRRRYARLLGCRVLGSEDVA